MYRWFALLPILAIQLPAQDQATTLARLTHRSHVIAQVRAVAVTDPDSLHHRVLFATEVEIAGQAPESFQITEPAGRGCGRALHGIEPGTGLVAFLVWDGGGLHLSVSSARSLAAATPELVEHVRALAGAGDDAVLARELASALSSSNPRVRLDAALALPTLAGLDRLDPEGRARILAALPGLLDRRDAGGAELLVAVLRLGLKEALETLVPRYLQGRDPELAPLVRNAIVQLGTAATARRIARHLPVDPAGRERAVELLHELPAPEARRALMELLTDPTRRVAVRAAAALLARGVQRSELTVVGPKILDEAKERLVAPPRFRSILRGVGR